MRRILSLWLPRFATDRIHRRHARERSPSPACGGGSGWGHAEGLVTALALAGRAVVAGVDDRAAAAGVAPGMPLADARAIAPGLRVHPADRAGDAAALDRLADWATRYTPWTSIEALDAENMIGGGGGLWLDVTGCAHLFDGEAALLGNLLIRFARCGHRARAAIADTPGAAWAAARFVEDPDGTGIVVPPRGARTLLAPLPVAALRLSPAVVADLERLGLRRIESLLAMPRAALARRFGCGLADRLDQSLGYLDEPLSPRRPIVAHRLQIAFAEPILEATSIAEGLRRLLHRLCAQLETEQLGARRLDLVLYRVDGTVQRTAIGTSRPNRDAAALARLFAERLDRIDPGFGIEAMAVAAPAVEPLTALQIVLAATSRAEAAPREDLAALIDTLGNRLGFANLRQLAPRESHIPERAVRAVAPLALTKPGGWPTLPPRPLRLFPRPEPIEAMALLPDHPPVMFRWRARLHRVRRAEGPERIEPEWWRPEDAEAAERDYFRVEDEAGRRFWLYRAGQPPASGRWYLQGLFG